MIQHLAMLAFGGFYWISERSYQPHKIITMQFGGSKSILFLSQPAQVTSTDSCTY